MLFTRKTRTIHVAECELIIMKSVLTFAFSIRQLYINWLWAAEISPPTARLLRSTLFPLPSPVDLAKRLIMTAKLNKAFMKIDSEQM